MKNAILSFALMLFGAVAFSQSTNETSNAQALTDQLTAKYNLSEKQQAQMLVVQQRKFRNLEEIEGLKKTDIALHIQKIRALAMANDYEMEKLLNKEQLAIYRQAKAESRKQKAALYQELKASGATEPHINYRISLLEEEALSKI